MEPGINNIDIDIDSISWNFLTFFNSGKQALVHKYINQLKILRQSVICMSTFFHVCDACLFPLVMVVSLNKVSHTSVSRAERFVTLKTGAILHSVSLAVHHFTSTSCVSPFGNVKNINWPTGWIGWTWQALMVLFRLFGSVFFREETSLLKVAPWMGLDFQKYIHLKKPRPNEN